MAVLWYRAAMLNRHLVAALALLVLSATTVACQSSSSAQGRASAATVAPEVARNSNGTLQKFPPAPTDVPGQMQVFAYADFGPQAAAHELLGLECYGECCCSELTDSFDVRVVVFAGVDRAQVSARFVSSAKLGDYRLVALPDALGYLETTLAQLQQGSGADRIPALEATLQTTLAKLRRDFGVAGTGKNP